MMEKICMEYETHAVLFHISLLLIQTHRKQFLVGPTGRNECTKRPLGCLGQTLEFFGDFRPSEIISCAIWG